MKMNYINILYLKIIELLKKDLNTLFYIEDYNKSVYRT